MPAPKSPRTLHPRACIRHALAKLLRGSAFPGDVFANREEPWLQEELPVMGVYSTEESPLESDSSPRPDERRLTIAVDVLCAEGPQVDDELDTHALSVEEALTYETVAAACGPIVIVDLNYAGMSMGFAEEGDRILGVGSHSFTLDYRMPLPSEELAIFATGVTGWDLGDHSVGGGEGPDGRLEAEDIYHMPQEKA